MINGYIQKDERQIIVALALRRYSSLTARRRRHPFADQDWPAK